MKSAEKVEKKHEDRADLCRSIIFADKVNANVGWKKSSNQDLTNELLEAEKEVDDHIEAMEADDNLSDDEFDWTFDVKHIE